MIVTVIVKIGGMTIYAFNNVTSDHTIEASFESNHIFVTIGDSITEGTGDDDTSDDTSQDGKNTGGGYQPILNDLLTAYENGIPHNIINEGVSGDTSADGLIIIQSTLSTYPEALRYLVMYGTNDARPWLPVPSGQGLNPGSPGYPGTYKDNMQRIIDAINSAGKEILIAKPPITLGDNVNSTPYPDPDTGARSVLIKEYNQVIDELVSDPLNNITVTPPDFYNYFKEIDPATASPRYEDQYADNLHPNGIGYQSMAQLWFEEITGTIPTLFVVMDNGGVGTSSTGSWTGSTEGSDPWYGSNYLYSFNSGAAYTWENTFSPGTTKTFDVYKWWEFHSSRCTNVQVEISDSTGILDTLFIDQTINSGSWYQLGTSSYTFENYARVKIYGDSSGSCSVNADAVKLVPSI
jgi:lysophospholipase L1-like esterase